MSDQRLEDETTEQYARRPLSNYADGDLDAALEFSCQYCAGHNSMGRCRVMRTVASFGENLDRQSAARKS
jgi:hypothetical protein